MAESMKVFSLSNGIRVVLERMPYLKSVSAGIFINVGSASETAENNGISHCIEHMIFKGTTTRSAADISLAINELGDSINAFTAKESTCVYGTTLCEYVPQMLELMGDMIANSAIDPVELDREKKVILDEIDMYADSPEDLVHELLQQRVWRENSLGFYISGDKQVVKSFDSETVFQFMKEYYCASNIIISIAGSFEYKEMNSMLEKYFGGIGNPPRLKNPVVKKRVPDYFRCFTGRRKDIEQFYMNMAFPMLPAETPEKYAIAVMNNCLGGSNNSRLFKIIRDELALAYSVYSYKSAYRKAGLYHIDVTVNPSEAEAVFDRIVKIVGDVRKNGFTKEEIESNKRQLRIEMIMSNESAKSRMSSNGNAILHRGAIVPFEERLEKVMSVTQDEIFELCDRYLKPEYMSMCLVGKDQHGVFEKLKKDWNEVR